MHHHTELIAATSDTSIPDSFMNGYLIYFTEISQSLKKDAFLCSSLNMIFMFIFFHYTCTKYPQKGLVSFLSSWFLLQVHYLGEYLDICIFPKTFQHQLVFFTNLTLTLITWHEYICKYWIQKPCDLVPQNYPHLHSTLIQGTHVTSTSCFIKIRHYYNIFLRFRFSNLLKYFTELRKCYK